MTTLYKKVGRRYKPVAEHEEWDSYPTGAHLVICQPGSTMRRFSIDPCSAFLRSRLLSVSARKQTGRAATVRQLAHGRRARVAVLAGEEAPANTDAY